VHGALGTDVDVQQQQQQQQQVNASRVSSSVAQQTMLRDNNVK